MLPEEREKILSILDNNAHGLTLKELGDKLGVHGATLSQKLVAMRKEGHVIRRGTNWVRNTGQIAIEKAPPDARPASIDDIIAELEKRDSTQKFDIDSKYMCVLQDIHAKSIGNNWHSVMKYNLSGPEDLSNILNALVNMELVSDISSKISLTLKGLQACDKKWTICRVTYAVLDSIQEIDAKKDPQNRAVAYAISSYSGLYNINFFTDILDYLISKDAIGWEDVRIRNNRTLRAYVITKQGKELLRKLQFKLGQPAPKPQEPPKQTEYVAPPVLKAPEPPQQKPAEPAAPKPVQVTAPVQPVEKPRQELEEICFSWIKVKPEIVTIEGNAYKIVAVGEKGNLLPRVTEAKNRGCIGLSNYEKKYLTEIAGYFVNGVFDMHTAMEKTGLPKIRILNLLESYREKGIKFAGIASAPAVSAKPAVPSTDYGAILKQYEDGRSKERDAIEGLVKLLQDKDNELADIKKRLAILEQKK